MLRILVKISVLLIIIFSFGETNAQTYQRDGKGIKFIQLEGCVKTSNGSPCDSCFVITNGLNGKLNRCIHISALRELITGGGGTDSTYLADNLDGTYSLFNENGDEFQFGYTLDVSATGDTLFIEDLDGHVADYLLEADFDNQTLSWNPGTGDLGISNGNTVNLAGFGDGNGIYGGSDTIPDLTLAYQDQDSSFAIGDFTSFPSTNNSDFGIIWGGAGNQGMHIFGGQKPEGRYGYGGVTCDYISLKLAEQFGPQDTRILLYPSLLQLYVNNIGSSSITITDTSIYNAATLHYDIYSGDSLRLNTNNLILEPAGGNRGSHGQVLTNVNGFAEWANTCCDTLSGGGVDSVNLNLVGNELTLYVDGEIDTSLVIGELETRLSGNTITTEVNNVTDTTLVIGNVNSSLSGTILTTSVNGVSDTAQLSGLLSATTNVLTYSNPILTSTVNGVTDTALVSPAGISNVDLDLSGNVMTNDVDGVSDTSLVIGNLTTDLSGTTLTTTVNGVSDTSDLSVLLSNGTTVLTGYSNEILTSTVNGVSDTAFIERDGNGIYGGSGEVPDSTYAYVPDNQNFVIGYSLSNPGITNTSDRALYFKNESIYAVVGDSINQQWGILQMELDNVELDYKDGAVTGGYRSTMDSTVMSRYYAANKEGSRIKMTDDSLYMASDMKFSIYAEDSLNINIAGTYGTSGQVLTSDGSKATWQNAPSGGATSNNLGLSGNVMTSDVDGVIDTSLVVGELNTNLSGNILSTEINNVTDTSLIIGSNVIEWDSTNQILTSTINGVTDTTEITIASGGATSNTLSLSGNTMTSNVDGVIDTSLVIGSNEITYDRATKILTSTINGVTDTAQLEAVSVITPAQITSDQDDYSPSGFAAASTVIISGDNGIRAITSFSSTGISNGERKTIINGGSYPVYFPGNHPDAGVANEFEIGEDYILMPNKSIDVMWIDNSADDYWVILGYEQPKSAKVMEINAQGGSTTAGDNNYLNFALSGGSYQTNTITSTFPFSGFSNTTGTGATNSSTLELVKTADEFSYLGENHIMGEWVLSIPTLSDATDSFDILAQFLNNPSPATAIPNQTWGFRYSHDAYGGNWYAFSKTTGANITTVDLGVTVAADTPYHLRCEINKTGTEIRFYIDGSYKGRITTDIPTSQGYAMRCGIFKGVGTAVRNLVTSKIGFRTVTP